MNSNSGLTFKEVVSPFKILYQHFPCWSVENHKGPDAKYRYALFNDGDIFGEMRR